MEFDADNAPQALSDFSLSKLRGIFDNYVSPPVGDFSPNGSWQQDYSMLVLGPREVHKEGEFSLRRIAKDTRNFALIVQIRRLGNSGFSQFQRAEIHCNADALATPISWDFETKLARDAHDPPYLQSGRLRSGVAGHDTLTLRDGLRTTRLALTGAYSNEWTLLEAVQRLPGEKFARLQYTLIDEYDSPQPGHQLTFRNTVNVSLRSGPIQLKGYLDRGAAVVPTTYWVDEHHRLLFVCSGLMIYALKATNGKSGQCPSRYNIT